MNQESARLARRTFHLARSLVDFELPERTSPWRCKSSARLGADIEAVRRLGRLRTGQALIRAAALSRRLISGDGAAAAAASLMAISSSTKQAGRLYRYKLIEKSSITTDDGAERARARRNGVAPASENDDGGDGRNKIGDE